VARPADDPLEDDRHLLLFEAIRAAREVLLGRALEGRGIDAL
jgi:hypothetical protein